MLTILTVFSAVIKAQHTVLQVSRPAPTGNVVLFTDGGGPPATIQMPYNQTTCHVRSPLRYAGTSLLY